MNFLKSDQKTVLIVLAVLTVPCMLLAQINSTAHIWGKAVNGLQISLSLDASVVAAHVPALKLDLQNVGTTDMTVNLGGGCEWPNPTDSVALILLDSTGISKRLTFQYKASGCAGGMGNLAPTLPPGGAFSTPIELDSYKIFPRSLTPDGSGYERGWQPGGKYTLEAELKDMGGTIHPSTNGHGQTYFWWGGTVTSNRLEIHIPAP
jgi:hypothetical protein